MAIVLELTEAEEDWLRREAIAREIDLQALIRQRVFLVSDEFATSLPVNPPFLEFARACLLVRGIPDSLARQVLPLLTASESARQKLAASLRDVGVDEDHPARQLLRQAEQAALWTEAARQAAFFAREDAHAAGVGTVHGENGRVFERLPDSSRQEL